MRVRGFTSFICCYFLSLHYTPLCYITLPLVINVASPVHSIFFVNPRLGSWIIWTTNRKCINHLGHQHSKHTTSEVCVAWFPENEILNVRYFMSVRAHLRTFLMTCSEYKTNYVTVLKDLDLSFRCRTAILAVSSNLICLICGWTPTEFWVNAAINPSGFLFFFYQVCSNENCLLFGNIVFIFEWSEETREYTHTHTHTHTHTQTHTPMSQ
jgi:hypothetical protein